MNTKEKKKPGSSHEQTKAEEMLILAFGKKIGAQLRKVRIKVGSGDEKSFVELDGYSEHPPVLCEAWAHIGPPKPAQQNKIMKDALKLIFLEKKLGKKCKKVLIFADENACKPFVSGKWMAVCLREYGIEMRTIPLSSGLRRKVLEAQKRQYR